MSSAPLSHDEFFTRLTALLAAPHSNNHGSVYLTQKRLSHPARGDTEDSKEHDTDSKRRDIDILTDLHPPAPLPVLIRASNGKSSTVRNEKTGKKVKRTGEDKKEKISTIVQPDDLGSFYERYTEVCRAGMASLKKRDRKGRREKEKKRRNKAKGATTAMDTTA